MISIKFDLNKKKTLKRLLEVVGKEGTPQHVVSVLPLKKSQGGTPRQAQNSVKFKQTRMNVQQGNP